MTIATIFLLILLITVSTKGAIFILKYVNLTRQGIETEGRIVSIEISKSIINKNAAIPIVSFVTFDQKIITNKPFLSWLFAVNNYLYQKDCVLYYDKLEPEKFIIKSKTEVLANALTITTTAFTLTYLLLKNL